MIWPPPGTKWGLYAWEDLAESFDLPGPAGAHLGSLLVSCHWLVVHGYGWVGTTVEGVDLERGMFLATRDLERAQNCTGAGPIDGVNRAKRIEEEMLRHVAELVERRLLK